MRLNVRLPALPLRELNEIEANVSL